MKKLVKQMRRRTPSRNVFCVSVKENKFSWRLGQNGWIILCSFFSCLCVGYMVHLGIQRVLQEGFYQNRDFSLRHIDIKVTGSLSKAEVLRWSGVRPGQNLLSVDMEQVRNDLSNIPYISHVAVERRLPDSLSIAVEERQPLAVLQPRSSHGHRLLQDVYYIDAQGFVIKPKPGEKLKNLPVIIGVDADLVTEGIRLDVPEVASSLNFIHLIDLSPVQRDLDLNQIDVSARGYLIVRTRTNGQIRFRTDFLDQQLQRLEVIFDFARKEQHVVRTADLAPEQNVPVVYF